MKKLVNIVLAASALGLSGCVASNTYENHFRKERVSKKLIAEVANKYEAREGYIPAEKGNDLLSRLMVDYTLKKGESIMLEPAYGPYNKAPKGKINILLKKSDESIFRTVIDSVHNQDVMFVLYGDIRKLD